MFLLRIILVVGLFLCAFQAQAQAGDEGAAKRHLKLGLSCLVCHTSGTKKPANEKSCIQCHGSYAALGEKNANTFTQNPHKGHFGPLACTSCHHGHKRDTEYCQGCHPEMEIEKVVPGPVPLEPKLDCRTCHPEEAGKVGNSAHAGLTGLAQAGSCSACHEAHPLAPLPIATSHSAGKSAAQAKCRECHTNAADVSVRIETAHSLHTGAQAPNCVDCHSAHGVQRFAAMLGSRRDAQQNGACLRCHVGNLQSHARLLIPTEERKLCTDCHRPHAESPIASSAATSATCVRCHQALPEQHKGESAAHLRDLKLSVHADLECVQCHTGARVNHSLQPGQAKMLAASCTTGCHQQEAREYALSAHATNSTAGEMFSISGAKLNKPTCIDCHGSHKVFKHDDPRSPVSRQNAVSLCVQCHDGETAASYFASYHGQAARLGSMQTAQCVDCHGAHAALPSSDPRSRVAQWHLRETCGACHHGSTQSFTSYSPHAQSGDGVRFQRLYWVSRAMHGLLWSVLSLFGLHLLLWLPRACAERWRRRIEAREAANDQDPSSAQRASEQEAD